MSAAPRKTAGKAAAKAKASPKARSPRAVRPKAVKQVNILDRETRNGVIFPHNTMVRVLKHDANIKVSATAADRADQVIHEAVSILARRARDHINTAKVVTVQREHLTHLPLVACHFLEHLGEYVAKVKKAVRSGRKGRAASRSTSRSRSRSRSSSRGPGERELPAAVSTKLFKHYLLLDQTEKYRVADDAKHAINRIVNHMAHELGKGAGMVAAHAGKVTIDEGAVEVASRLLYPWLP